MIINHIEGYNKYFLDRKINLIINLELSLQKLLIIQQNILLKKFHLYRLNFCTF